MSERGRTKSSPGPKGERTEKTPQTSKYPPLLELVQTITVWSLRVSSGRSRTSPPNLLVSSEGVLCRCPTQPTLSSNPKLIPVPEDFAGKAHCPSLDAYNEMYQRSIEDPDGFWAEIADTFVWDKKWDKVCDYTLRG